MPVDPRFLYELSRIIDSPLNTQPEPRALKDYLFRFWAWSTEEARKTHRALNTIAASPAAGAIANNTFVTIDPEAATLPFSRQLAATAPITRLDSGPGSTVAIGVTLSGLTPQPLGIAAPGATGQISDAGHVHSDPGYSIGPGTGGSVAGRLAVFSNANGAIDDSPAIDATLVALSPASTVTDSVPTWVDAVGNLQDTNRLRVIGGAFPRFSWNGNNLATLGNTGNRWRTLFLGSGAAVDFNGLLLGIVGSDLSWGGNFITPSLGGSLGNALVFGDSSDTPWVHGAFYNGISMLDDPLGGGSVNYLAIMSLSNPAHSADRILTLDLADASRTLRLTGNLTGDQDVSTTGSPTLASLTLTANLSVQGNTTIGNATTDTVRFNAGGNAAAPATNAIGVLVDYYGTSATRVLTTPNRWWSIIADDGNTYKIPLYA